MPPELRLRVRFNRHSAPDRQRPPKGWHRPLGKGMAVPEERRARPAWKEFTVIMRSFAHLALAAGSLSVLALASTSADAQRRNRDREQQAAQPATPPVSRAFATAYQPLQAQLAAQAWAAADALLPAAKAAAANPYEQYLVARAELSISTGLNDAARQGTAITAVIASNGIPATEAVTIYSAGAQIAYRANDFATAATRAQRAIESGATGENMPLLLLDSLFRSNQVEQGITQGRAIIAAANAAGRQAPESVYSRLASAFQEANRTPELQGVLLERYAAYPSAFNMRAGTLIYLDSLPANMDADLNRSLTIDALRLMAAAGGMDDRRFFVEYVASLAEEALPNAVLTSIAAGRAAGKIPASGSDATFDERELNATDNLNDDRSSLATSEARARSAQGTARLATRLAHSYYTYNNFAKAEELLLLAQSKPDADADLINLRLGQARFGAGNVPGALEALAQVQGVRSDLAKLWAAYIQAQSPAPAAAAPAAAPAPTAS